MRTDKIIAFLMLIIGILFSGCMTQPDIKEYKPYASNSYLYRTILSDNKNQWKSDLFVDLENFKKYTNEVIVKLENRKIYFDKITNSYSKQNSKQNSKINYSQDIFESINK